MIGDKQKQEVIWFIDDNIAEFYGTTFFADLKMLKYKYIYKDISHGDYYEDLNYLNALWKLLRNDYKKIFNKVC
jgi:hypothetical protein